MLTIGMSASMTLRFGLPFASSGATRTTAETSTCRTSGRREISLMSAEEYADVALLELPPTVTLTSDAFDCAR